MKFNEPFEQPNNPEENTQKEIIKIIKLAKKNIALFNAISEKLRTQDEKIIILTKALLREEVFKKIHKDLENKFDELTNKSYELIESPDSNKPEVKEERRRIADQINKIMEKQEEFKPLIDSVKESEFIIDSSSREDIKKAESLIAEITLEIDSLGSDSELN